MQGYRDDGVVLRTQKLGEADRIITLLTRQNGRVRAVAKGIRRTKSRFGARLEPFTHVDVLIHPGRSLDIITQAEVIRAYGTPLAADYPRYTAGTAMLETAERFTPEEKEPAIRQFLLLIGGLRALGETAEPADADDPDDTQEEGQRPAPLSATQSARRSARAEERGTSGEGAQAALGRTAASAGSTGSTVPRDPRMVLDAYFLRSLSFAGYAPALAECARCGAPQRAPNEASGPQPAAGKPLVAFAVAAGGMVCAGCRPPGAASPAAETVNLMIALLRGDWDAAMRSEQRHRVECSGLVAAYLQWHLEHSIRSLRHVERA